MCGLKLSQNVNVPSSKKAERFKGSVLYLLPYSVILISLWLIYLQHGHQLSGFWSSFICLLLILRVKHIKLWSSYHWSWHALQTGTQVPGTSCAAAFVSVIIVISKVKLLFMWHLHFVRSWVIPWLIVLLVHSQARLLKLNNLQQFLIFQKLETREPGLQAEM